MKKLMIAACAIAFAAIAQAAYVNWNCAGTLVSGNPTDLYDEGNVYAQDGLAVYLFDQGNALTTRDALMAAIATGDYTDFFSSAGTPMYVGKIATFEDSFGGAFGASNVEMIGPENGTTSGYAVILDSSDITTAQNAFITDVFTADVGNTGAADITVTNYGDTSDWYGALNATTGWTQLSAAPEPTSGLLLLLGVAGLALRRRRA